MKIYVASSWRNIYQESVVEFLRGLGHSVYDFKNPEPGVNGFSWAEIDPAWKSWNVKEYRKALKHPIAKSGFMRDFKAMCWAEVCVLVLPCGRSAHTEAGWFAGQYKKVFVYQPMKEEPELMYKIFDGIAENGIELINLLR